MLLKKYNADTSIKWNGDTGLHELYYKDKNMYNRIIQFINSNNIKVRKEDTWE